jgi:Ice-binding-like
MIKKHRRILLGAALTAFLVTLATIGNQPWSGLTAVKAAQVPTRGGAVAEMLAFALNFRTAANYQIMARNGARKWQGTAIAASEIDPGAESDLGNAVKAVGQLPCEAVESSSLGGRSFGPGVYCLSSADLDGSMTLDAGRDPHANFVFRVNGPVHFAADSSIYLENGARADSVFIVSSQNITVGDHANIAANLIAAEDVSLGEGSTVSGRVASVKGSVQDNGGVVAAPTGYIEVCKELAPGDPIAFGTLFTFNVAGSDYLAPAGACTAPILVNAGNVTIVEAVRANTAVVAINSEPAVRLFSSNLGTRTAVVSVPEGDAADQTIVTFTNQTTRTGTLEICKYGLDSDVAGFFNYTVQGVTPTATSTGVITVPVGFCSGVITTTVPQTPASPLSAIVTELARPAFRLEAVDTLPINKLAAAFTPNEGYDANGVAIANNTNGGFATVLLNEGGPSSQVLVNFRNRSLPGRIKVCKITADPVNLPVGTLFRFTANGLQPTSPTQTMPGVSNTVTFDVPAGPASQNGFCVFVPATWVVGLPVTIDENGVSPNNLTTVGPGEVRASRIRSITGLISSNLMPAPGVVASAVITVRNATSEAEFTNYLFRPAILKLCKSGGPGVSGTATFTLALPDPLTSLPVSSTPITVPVNYCTLVGGPFPASASFPGVGTFNMNTQLTITEAASANSVLTSVTSPTNSPITQNLTARTGTITLDKSADLSLWNEIAFLNSVPSSPKARYDFDGDGKSDMAIYRRGMWWYAASGSAMAQTPIQFGSPSDKVVAADYDGDGKTDAAVYRNGTWYILGSTQGMMTASFGVATDIPEPADYDGDGKADIAVFRPSDGMWYMQLSQAGFRAVQFGVATDRPVAADFDGDGKTDPAVFRDGVWYVLGSSAGFYGVQFGTAGDVPVQADYDGDGKADEAVFRGGTWHILGSTSGYKGLQFGLAGDTPVPADYDGDGKTDLVVYRPSTTVWHSLLSGNQNNISGGYTSSQFGAGGDVLLNY